VDHTCLAGLTRARNAESRSISAENPTGARGQGARATAETSLHPASVEAARDLGVGWKVSPAAKIDAGATFTMAEIEGPGVVRHIWLTTDAARLRDLVLRVYYDGQAAPAIAVPLGDFFCQAWGGGNQVNAIPVNVNSLRGMNCFWPMPFGKSVKMTVTNDGPDDCPHFYYTVNYTLEDVASDELYLHASWRRHRTQPGHDFLIADIPEGRGHYVGTFLAWQQNSVGWWGEGEVKVFTDDDDQHPTICGTGTEDYFLGAWGFSKTGAYSAPFAGFDVLSGENAQVGARMTMYRFHIPDPIHFRKRLRMTCQALGWRRGHRYQQLSDDVSATAWWYQSLPSAPLPDVGDGDFREQC
jgi:hypothetical protein